MEKLKMINFNSIKFRLVLLTVSISLILLVMLGIVVPLQTRSLSAGILKENAFFITNLLAENLALGMQTMILDDGDYLRKSIDLLKSDKGESLLSDIAVYDNNGKFVAGMTNTAANILLNKEQDEIIIEHPEQIVTQTPMYDQSTNELGFVIMVFSKKSFIKKINGFTFTLWIVTAILLSITVVLILLLTTSIVNSLSKTTNILQDIASGEGDLTRRIDLSSSNELGVLSKWFNTFVKKLQSMVKNVKENVQTLNDILSELPIIATESSDAAGKLRENAGNARQSIDKVNVSLEIIDTSSKDMSNSVGNVATAIEELNISIYEVTKQCQKEYSISQEANRKSKDALATVDSLGQSANDINRILVVIEDIADKINLLSLNATIQAASAGEAGREFAVVANEIKAMAKQTALSTDEIKNNISSMQHSVQLSVKAIHAIDTVINEINSISQIIVSAMEEQSSTTNEITRQVSNTRDNASNIKDGVSLSAKEISTVAFIMRHVDQVANKNEENAIKSQSAVVQLSSLSSKLQKIVDQFKI